MHRSDFQRTKPPRRTACARCHHQKLQCPREELGACERCVQAGLECVDRRPQRMGRPRETHNARAKDDTDKQHGQADDIDRSPSANQGYSRKRRRLSLPSVSTGQGSQDITSRMDSTGILAEDIAQLMDEAATWSANDEDDQQDDIYHGEIFPSVAMQGRTEELQDTYAQTAQEVLLSTGQHSDPGQPLSLPRGMGQANPVPAISTATRVTPTLKHVNPLSLFGQQTNTFTPAATFPQQIEVENQTADPALPGPEHAGGGQHQPERSGFSTEPYMKDYIHQLSDLCLSLYQCSKSRHPTETAFESLSNSPSIPSFALPSSMGSSPDSNLHGFQGVVGADVAFSASQDFIQILQSSAAKSHTPAIRLPDISVYDTPSQSSHQGTRMAVDTDFWLGQAFTSASSSSNHFAHATDPALYGGTEILLTLTCYLRLLHMYEPLVRSILRQQQQLRSADIPHILDVRVGTFSPSSSSELRVFLLVQIISHLLNRIDRAIQKTLSPVSHSPYREQNPSPKQRLRQTMSNGGGYGGNFGASSASSYVDSISQNSDSESPVTTEMAGGAFGAVLDEMGNLESNLRKDLNSLKSLLQDSLMA